MTGEIVYLKAAPELSMVACSCDNRLWLAYTRADEQFLECTSCGTQYLMPLNFGDEDASDS